MYYTSSTSSVNVLNDKTDEKPNNKKQRFNKQKDLRFEDKDKDL